MTLFIDFNMFVISILPVILVFKYFYDDDVAIIDKNY